MNLVILDTIVVGLDGADLGKVSCHSQPVSLSRKWVRKWVRNLTEKREEISPRIPVKLDLYLANSGCSVNGSCHSHEKCLK